MADMTIRPAGGTWSVRAGGAVLVESDAALALDETGHDTVIYFPRDDVGMAFLERSETVTECPLKGRATHYNIVTKSTVLADAAWSYEAPFEAAREIAGHLAFYCSDPVTVEEI